MQLDYLEADLLKVFYDERTFKLTYFRIKKEEKRDSQTNKYKPFVLIRILFSNIGLLQEKREK